MKNEEGRTLLHGVRYRSRENKIYIQTIVQDGRPGNLGFDSPENQNIFSSTEPRTGWVPGDCFFLVENCLE